MLTKRQREKLERKKVKAEEKENRPNYTIVVGGNLREWLTEDYVKYIVQTQISMTEPRDMIVMY